MSDDHVQITAYNDDTEKWRHDRLRQTLWYAAGRAAEKHRIAAAVFLAHILAVHDHKGSLSCLWNSLAAVETFGALLTNAWSEQAENPDMVGHFVDDHFITRGYTSVGGICDEWEMGPKYSER